MKTVLKIGAAALALSLMGSASAFAQASQTNASPAASAPEEQSGTPASSATDSQSGSSMSGPPMSGQGGAAASGANPGGMGQGSTSGAPSPDQGAMTKGDTGQGPMAQGSAPMAPSAVEIANTPAGSPPATYPACKHKGEDRCIQEASISGSHHMRHRMTTSKKSTAAMPDMSGAAAPATPPAPGQ